MTHTLKFVVVLLFAASSALHASEIALLEPLDYQVIQRTTRTEGELHVRGKLKDAEAAGAKIEARIVTDKGADAWRILVERLDGDLFDQPIKAPAGGWYQLEVRALAGDKIVAESMVEHVGIGEIFVVAGQSNSANHGETRQVTETRRVAAFDGQQWQLANDPQPGASGKGGSFMPPFGDAVVKCIDVPVGFIACGIGATSVREWLPKGATFPNPPTIESRVTKLPSGEWASNGDAFAKFVSRMKQAGNHGFRAVLWHQGESDANQKDPSRTLPGKPYREYLERIIRESRREIGWDAPWFVAQASYHVPGDEASPEIRDAQASLWKDGIALEGPDTDALKGELREGNGQGVHFSAKGLREHAAKWAEKVCPWIEQELKSKGS
ncbi:sialate O-acetylesterase [Verrucomicrobiota bacterium sgz303538]